MALRKQELIPLVNHLISQVEALAHRVEILEKHAGLIDPSDRKLDLDGVKL